MKVMVAFLSVLFLGGCGWLYQAGNNNPSEFDMSAANFIVPEFEFVNQDEESFGTKQLKGEYWLANMIFTHCPSVCPTMTPNMKRLQEAAAKEGIDMQFVTFTIDPERDTTEALYSYGTNVGANFESWNFLTGYSSEEIIDFSMDAFKSPVQYDEAADDFLHSTSFFLVDPEGQVIRKYDGLQSNQEPFIKDLKETVE